MKRYTIILSFISLVFISFVALLGATGCAAGTLVKTADGYIPIESLKKDDTVLCFDFKDALVEKPVTRIIKKA